jgi:nitric oxide synthase-interacting protein
LQKSPFSLTFLYTTVAQKKDIKRQKDRLEALKKEVEEERSRARQAARERVLRDFERGQLVLGNNSSSIEKFWF